MKKLILLFAFCILFSGCGKAASVGIIRDSDNTEGGAVANELTVKLYYPDENAEGLTTEEYKIAEKTPEAVLEALFGGPYTEMSAPVFGEGTKLLGFELTAGEATVDVSKEFLKSTGDSLAIYSVVNTLTDFDNISFVCITVEGAENEVLGNYILSESFTRNESLLK